MSIYVRVLLRFLMLFFIQIMVLSKIPLLFEWKTNLPSYTPYIYMLFIALLPVSVKTSYMIVFSFITGLTMDIFSDTGGIHAIACLFMGVSRTPILRFILPKPLQEYKSSSPSLKEMKTMPFVTYILALFFVHLLVYYFIEIWSFKAIGYLGIKLLFSLLTACIFALIYTMIFSKSIEKRYFD